MARKPNSEKNNHGIANTIQNLAASQSVTYGQKINIEGNPDLGLAIILTEINETVLPRRIEIECSPVGTVMIKASSRRLLDYAGPNHFKSDPSSISDDAYATANFYLTCLRGVVSSSTAICIRAPEPVSDAGDLSMSCAAATLLQMSGLEPIYSGKKDALVSLIEQASVLAQAWCLNERGSASCHNAGPKAATDMLEKIQGALGFKDPTPRLGLERRRAVILPFDEKVCLMIVEVQLSRFLAVLPMEAIDDLPCVGCVTTSFSSEVT